MKKNFKILLTLISTTLFLLSCNIFSEISKTFDSIEDGQTAIVELTQISENLSQETQIAKVTQTANSILMATQTAEAHANQPSVISSNFETIDIFNEFTDDDNVAQTIIKDGVMHMEIFETDSFFWAYPNAITPIEVIAQVDAKLIEGGEEIGAGLVCKHDYETDHGFYFEITFDGYYVIFKYSGDDIEYIQDFKRTNLINSDEFNTIKAICDEHSYQFFINGEEVYNFIDYDTLGSETALYIYTYSQPVSKVIFDNYYLEGLK